MLNITGFISFPNIFTPRVRKRNDGTVLNSDPVYSCELLIPNNDPQLPTLIKTQEDLINANLTSDKQVRDCRRALVPYHEKHEGTGHYRSELKDYYVLALSSSEEDKPPVLDRNHQPVVDKSVVYPGKQVVVACNITYYAKGNGGIGGWLNGVMVLDGEIPCGRLDNKPNVEDMFSQYTGGATATTPASAPAPAPAPTPAAAPPPVPNAAPQLTEKAAGTPYQAFIDNGWTDEQLRAEGYLV